MNAWTRVNLLLAALTGLLLALHLWPAATPPQRSLTNLSPGAISSVRIERAGRLEIALQRHSDGWQLVQPQQSAAVGRRVEQLLAIARAPVQRSYPVRDGLAQYALDQPRAVLQLDETRLEFGDRDPTQKLRYVRLGDEVLVIDDVYFNLLTLPARHFSGA